MIGHCTVCGRQFETIMSTRRYCNRQCENRDWSRIGGEGNLPPDRGPDEWDGVTAYSNPGYAVTRWEASCLHCGELYDLDTLASRRCSRCGGPLHAEPVDVGGLRSAMRGRIA